MIIGPAITAGIITFILNTRDERRRTLRDYHLKFIDDTRADIRSAVAAGVTYFTCADNEKLRELQAQVSLYEGDIRASLALIRRNCTHRDSDLIPPLIEKEGRFLGELTGGDFGSAEAKPDLERALKIVGRGSLLRSELARLRRHHLDQDPWWLRPLGLLILLSAMVLVAFSAGVYLGLLLPV